MPSNRRYNEKQVKHYYTKKFKKFNKCVYCGEPATTQDHVFPLSRAVTLNLSHPRVRKELKQGLNMVPSCMECNRIASDRPFVWIREKRAFIQKQLKKKARKLGLIIWDKDELEELGPTLRQHVARKQARLGGLELRTSWPNAQTRVDEVAIVAYA